MTFKTKNPVGGAETRKSAIGNDAKDKAHLIGGGRGRDSGLRGSSDTGLHAHEFAKKHGGEALKENSWTGKGGSHRGNGVL